METHITTREKDVLKLLLSGFSNKEIAGKLSLSTETIKVHRRNIYSKLNIKSQSELFARFFYATAGDYIDALNGGGALAR